METTTKKIKNYFKRKKIVNNAEIKKFIMYYERLTKHMLQNYGKIAKIVVHIDEKHRLNQSNQTK